MNKNGCGNETTSKNRARRGSSGRRSLGFLEQQRHVNLRWATNRRASPGYVVAAAQWTRAVPVPMGCSGTQSSPPVPTSTMRECSASGKGPSRDSQRSIPAQDCGVRVRKVQDRSRRKGHCGTRVYNVEEKGASHHDTYNVGRMACCASSRLTSWRRRQKKEQGKVEDRIEERWP
jgi:hypothetical protein